MPVSILSSRLYRLLLWAGICCLAVSLLVVHPATASAALVQSSNANANATSVSISYATTPVAGHLLVVACSTNVAATLTGPSGFTAAINESTDPGAGIFYKIAAGTESSISCSFSAGGNSSIQIYEYSGIEDTSPLDIAAGGSTGTGTTGSTPSLTTRNANDLLFAFITDDTSAGISAWTNSFTAEQSGQSGGKQSTRISYSGADLTVTSAGTYSASATVPNANWRGQMAAFKIAPAAAFSADIVDGTGTSIASPTVAMTAKTVGFACQTSTGTLGASTQKIRITNTTPAYKNGWTLSLAANTPNWSDGAGHTYAYNDSTGSPAGCTNGQLTVIPTSEVFTPETAPEYGCTTTGLAPLSASTAFSAGTPSITIASALSTASHYCYWDLTGLTLSQLIPPAQHSGSYAIGLTLTLTAN